jgi:hypothetical protein
MLLAAGKPVPPPHSLGGGIPGITPVARDWAQAAVGLPTGTAMLGKAFGLDAAGIARALVHGQAYGTPHLKALARQGWQTTMQDLQHPLRHPGFTLLDLIPSFHAYSELGKSGLRGSWKPGRGTVGDLPHSIELKAGVASKLGRPPAGQSPSPLGILLAAIRTSAAP